MRDEEKNIEQLYQENLKLKQLLRENSIEFEEKSPLNYPVENDRFRNARSISKLAYWAYTYETKKLECSEEAYSILEIPPSEEIKIDSIATLIHPENRKACIAQLTKKIVSERFFTLDTRIVVSDGSIKYVSIKAITERNQRNDLLTISGTLTDITDHQFYIDKLRGNEELFRSLFNNLTDIFIIFEVVKDSDNTIIDYIYKDVNPIFEMKMGVTKAEVLEKRLSARPGFFQQLNPFFQLSIIAGQPQQDRIFFQSLDGFFDILIYSPSDNIIATIWRDVTLMVEAESSLRESEEKYRQIFSIGSDALFMFDFFSGRIIDVNPTACTLFGYSKDALLKMLFKQLSSTSEKLNEQIQDQRNLLHDFIAVKSDKSEFPIEISLSYFNWSGRKVSVASIRDISERVAAQEELIKSEQKFKQLFDFSNDAILIIKNYRIIDFNQKSISLFKMPPEELMNKTLWNLSPSKQSGGEESRNKAVEFIQNSLLGNQLQIEWVFQYPNHGHFIADIKLSPIVVGNEKVVQAIVRDISPQKETQKALIMKEELWKTSLNISSTGVWEWNIITKEVYFSGVWRSMLGYEKNELTHSVDELFSRIHADDIIQYKKTLDDYLTSKSNHFVFDFRLRCKNGTFKWIHSQGRIYSYDDVGKPERFIGTHIDITKQKVTEEKLNHEIHDLSFSNNISQLGYWSLDLRTMVLTGSRNTFSILGFSDTEQISLRQIEKNIHHEDQQPFIAQFVAQTTQPTLENEFRIMVDNSTKFILSRSRPIRNQKNILTGFRGTFQEITSLKQDYAHLNYEKTFYSNLVENLQYPLQVVRDKMVKFSNGKIAELTGYTLKDITARNITPFTFCVPEDRIQINKMVDSVALKPSQSERAEVRIETKNNRIKWAEVIVSSVETTNETAIVFQLIDISDRKKTESELNASQKMYQSMVNSSVLSIALVTNKGQLIKVNDSFCSLTGFSPSDIKTKMIHSFFSEPDFKAITKGLEALTLSISKNFKIDISQLGNSKTWIRLTVVPVKDEKGDIEYFNFYFDDIDSEKKKMLNLEEAGRQGKMLIENSPIGQAVVNGKQEFIRFNSRFAEDILLDTNQKSKINLSEIAQLSPNLNQIVRTVFKENSPFRIEINPAPEKFIQVDFIPVKNPDNLTIAVYSSDITSSKAKNDSLEIELSRYKSLFDLSPLGILLIDKNRNIILSNQKIESYFSFTANELRYIKLDSLIDTPFLGDCISKFSQLFAGISSTFELTLKMNIQGDESHWMNAHAASVKDTFGDSKYAILTIEDISQLKDEEQGMLANERLQTLSYIANSFAHEFNNLLMAIYGNSYLLNNFLKDSPLLRYTSDLLLSTGRASELTHKLLSFSNRSNSLNIILKSEELLAEISNSLNLGSHIKFRNTTSIKNELLIGDPYQLKRAFNYIIENGVESMPKGGTLTLETNVVYFEPDAIDDISGPGKGKYLRIVVSDTGTGIAKSDINKIFDPFYSTKPGGLNTGLGLAIAKQIITSHKGIIKVFSQKEKGTQFNVYLPIKETDKTTSINQPDEKRIIKGSAKILLVDDEEVVRFITSELLNELGYDVYGFAGGKKALNFYAENYATIDLVILDKHMPEMDGIEVYHNLKKISKSVKVIMLTGYNIDEEIEKLFTENLNGYIQKPVSIEKLSRAIAQVLFNRN
jgi:PAS domain S-box-containing protein